MGVVVDLILTDIIADIRGAVGLVQKCEVFLIFSIKIRDSEQCGSGLRDRGHITPALRERLHLGSRPVQTPLRLVQTYESDSQADEHDDQHDRKEAQIVNDIDMAGIQREIRDQSAYSCCGQSCDNISKSPHIPFPLIMNSIGRAGANIR